MHGCTESHLTDMWQYGDDLKIIVQNQPVELLTKITQCLEENSDRKLDLTFMHDYRSKPMIDICLLDSFLQCLSKAVVNDNLPNLTHLVFNCSGSSVTGKLRQLLTGVATFICWPKLTHLDLTRCG